MRTPAFVSISAYSWLTLAIFATSSVRAGAAETAAPASPPAYVAKVFDLSKLHRIEVVVHTSELANFKKRDIDRVHGTFSFDGTVIHDIGVRQQGGTWLRYVGINEKPSLSLKFNEFVKGQDLFGLNKLILKNERQDRSLLNEHLTYEIWHRAGQPAPLTAYAQVIINGIDQGIYLMREAVNQQFFRRYFGKERDNGNLYEIVQDIDPITFTEKIDLKDEVEEKRSRADIRGLAAAAISASPATFERAIAPHLDLDRFITFFALETATSHADGYTNNVNNTYVYALPPDGRFIFVPTGADQSFWVAANSKRIFYPTQKPHGALALSVLGVPELKKKYEAELLRIGSPPVWDKAALLARVAQVEKLILSAKPSDHVTRDLAAFRSNRKTIEAFINNAGTTRGTDKLPQR